MFNLFLKKPITYSFFSQNLTKFFGFQMLILLLKSDSSGLKAFFSKSHFFSRSSKSNCHSFQFQFSLKFTSKGKTLSYCDSKIRVQQQVLKEAKRVWSEPSKENYWRFLEKRNGIWRKKRRKSQTILRFSHIENNESKRMNFSP